MTCPLCTVAAWCPARIHEHYRPLIAEHNLRPCEKCKTPVVVPPPPIRRRPPIAAASSSSPRRAALLAQMLPDVTSCDDCGGTSHLRSVDHFKKVHAH